MKSKFLFIYNVGGTKLDNAFKIWKKMNYQLYRNTRDPMKYGKLLTMRHVIKENVLVRA